MDRRISVGWIALKLLYQGLADFIFLATDHLRADYLKQNRLTADLKIKSANGKKKSDFDLEAEQALRSAGKGRLERLDAILEGNASLDSGDGDISRYVFAAANIAARKEISEGIEEGEAYEWMKNKSFPGIIREAKEIMVSERLTDKIARAMEKNKITIASFE